MMKKIFSGIYSWDGKKHDERAPIAWFPGSYHLHICKMERGAENVTLLKSSICIYQETGKGHSISADPERFVRHICDDFSLAVDRVLWVERSRLPAAGDYQVIVFTKSGRLGGQDFYRVSKRPPIGAELQLIEQAATGSGAAAAVPFTQQV